jgi:hypothetical protein
MVGFLRVYAEEEVKLGMPVGLVIGIALVPLTYLGVTSWEERRATGAASETTVRRFWTTTAALVGFVVGGGVAVVALATQAVGLASAILLAGLPVGVISGGLAAYLVFRRTQRRRVSTRVGCVRPPACHVVGSAHGRYSLGRRLSGAAVEARIHACVSPVYPHGRRRSRDVSGRRHHDRSLPGRVGLSRRSSPVGYRRNRDERRPLDGDAGR